MNKSFDLFQKSDLKKGYFIPLDEMKSNFLDLSKLINKGSILVGFDLSVFLLRALVQQSFLSLLGLELSLKMTD